MTSVARIGGIGIGVLVLCLAVVFSGRNGGLDQGTGDSSVGSAFAELQFSSTDLVFGKVPVGQQSTKSVTLTNKQNTGGGALVVDNLFLDEHDSLYYTVDKQVPIRLEAGQSVTLAITFTPAETGQVPGRLIVNHSGHNASELIDLIGFGADTDPDAPAIAAAIPGPYPFGKSLLKGFGGAKPTSLQFGPDGKLYVAMMNGVVHVLEIERSDSNEYSVVDQQIINLVKNIPNHNDDGSPKPSVNERLVTGLLVTGTASDPVIYISSSDPRIGGGHSGNTTGLDTNSGILSRLTKSGNGWQKLDLVRGLPRSEENHHTNGLALSDSGDKLYLAAGGNTNMGAPSNNFARLPEYALSAAILEIDLTQIGDTTYDLPTLDDEDRAGVNDFNDPFGGNRGKNQAMLVDGGPVQVYAPGFRNPYDVVIMQDGRMYSWDNGPNSGWGGKPSNCSNNLSEPGYTQHDALHLITGPGYYGGHPNPTRANTGNTFNSSNPQSPVSSGNAVECNFYGPGQNGLAKHVQNKSLVSLPRSTTGITEYTASNFNGDMQGSLLATSWSNTVQRVTLDNNGAMVANEVLFSNVGTSPLDVTSPGDNGIFPGTIWVADFQGKKIVIYEPDDYLGGASTTCLSGNGPQDADGDGFTDADENLNATNPCSAGDFPPDADGDNISDIKDPDDDNDGLADVVDPFALDKFNGKLTDLGVDYQWENDSESGGFIADMGFSGLMTNSVDSYLSQFDLNEMTIRGAAGVVTIDNVTAGDPIKSKNTQEYAFQFGVNVNSGSPVFRIRSRILAPFSGVSAKPHQSMGIYMGTGDQDNYLKLVVNSKGPEGGLQYAREVAGAFNGQQNVTASIYSAEAIDLIIEVDPGSALATGFYQLTHNGQAGEVAPVGPALTFPAEWLNNPTSLAVGIISTSIGAEPFPATWDSISVKPLEENLENQAPQVSIASATTAIAGVPLQLDGNISDDASPLGNLAINWSKLSGPGAANFSAAGNSSTAVTFTEQGNYQLALSVSDGQHTTTATVSISVSVLADTQSLSSAVYRINAGGGAVSGSGDDWESDKGASTYANTGKIWAHSAEIDTSLLTETVPAALFATERFDSPGGPELLWQFPVTPGIYEVRLYFSENYFGAQFAGARKFDVTVEGQTLAGIDIYAEAGGYTAIMKSLTVSSDDSLDIQFTRAVQNPSIKAIEVLSVAQTPAPAPAPAPAPTPETDPVVVIPQVNVPPVVAAGADASTTVGDVLTLQGSVADDGLPNAQLGTQWSMVSGPGTASFVNASGVSSGVQFSAAGVYTLRLSATDGELSGTDDILVTVAESAPLIFECNGKMVMEVDQP
ncbi:hypothetical protein AB833_14800 [Chromatiales bacterium (ex Bugula neritina AB1)]|nr:hypothetical protein AB833_14800 [Chromatiales bacterium (ex Bugula neritina AB1)]